MFHFKSSAHSLKQYNSNHCYLNLRGNKSLFFSQNWKRGDIFSNPKTLNNILILEIIRTWGECLNQRLVILKVSYVIFFHCLIYDALYILLKRKILNIIPKYLNTFFNIKGLQKSCYNLLSYICFNFDHSKYCLISAYDIVILEICHK